MTHRVAVAVVVCFLVMALGAAGPLQAQLPPQDAIHCRGTESGGDGLRTYHYDIINGEPVALTDVYVGTDDVNAGNYSNWMTPAGWTVAIEDDSIWKNTFKTAHGLIAPPPNEGDLTLRWVHWWNVDGQPIAPGAVASFGFDNDNRSINVDWWTAPQGNTWAGANWNSPVGTGVWGVWTDGPVHGPVPEPSCAALIVLGVVALTARRKR